jgi:crotonobetainyl-CoA:carnitine CoA-transferase CaiB-like acyl-CoA transferase
MQPLENVLVIDLSIALAGPYCSLMLADYGAEVIKIEMPGRGDDTRAWGPPFVEGESAYFLSINRNKKSLTLNLKTDEGKKILLKLIKNADVLLENFRPGTLDRLGLGFEVMKKENPRLVYCAISGFGQNGPYKDKPGYDQILQGMGGLMSITGEVGKPPVKVGVAVTDIAAGMFAAYGILLALMARSKTGMGQMVDVSMLDCQVAWLTYQAGRYFASGEIPEKVGSGHPLIVPYQAFRARDKYINIACGNDKLYSDFCNAIGRPDLMSDPRFSTNPSRLKNRSELVEILQSILEKEDASSWTEKLEKVGVPCGPIYDMKDIFSDPHVLARNMLQEIEHPKYGRIKQTGVPVKIEGGKIKTAPPILGEHNHEILETLGYSGNDIERLKREGVI